MNLFQPNSLMCNVSVYMPCLNVSPFIEECVESVLSQSFEDFELVIVDDGSTDDTVERIRRFADPRIRLFRNEHNYIESLNLAVRKSQGKYIAKMDADDVMVQDRLLIQYNYMEHHPEVDLLGGGMELIGNAKGHYIPRVSEIPIVKEELLTWNVISHPTVMIRKTSLDRLPHLYEPDYVYAEDYKLWLSMLTHGLCLDNLPDIFCKYRISPIQVSITKRELQQATVEKIRAMYGGFPKNKKKNTTP